MFHKVAWEISLGSYGYGYGDGAGFDGHKGTSKGRVSPKNLLRPSQQTHEKRPGKAPSSMTAGPEVALDPRPILTLGSWLEKTQ